MRNYKLKLQDGFGAFGKTRKYSNNMHEQLIERGYEYNSLFRQYRKRVCHFNDIVLDLDKEKLYFYGSRFYTPAELDSYIKDKKDTDKIKTEVKWLKTNGFFVQKV